MTRRRRGAGAANPVVLNAVAPSQISAVDADGRLMMDRMVVDDRLVRVLYVAGRGYKTEQRIGWMEPLLGNPAVSVTFRFEPVGEAGLLKDLANQDRNLGAGLSVGARDMVEAVRMEHERTLGEQAASRVVEGGERFWNMAAYLVLRAGSEDELERLDRDVRGALANAGFSAKTAFNAQEGAFWAASPLMVRDPHTFGPAAAPVPTETIAGGLPFAAIGLNDGAGLVVGTDEQGGAVVIDPETSSDDRPAAHMIFVGKTGSGKSTLLKRFVHYCVSVLGWRVRIVDPEREFKKTCLELGGAWVDLGVGGAGMTISPWELRVPLVVVDPDDPDDLGESPEASALSYHMPFLVEFFSRALELTEDMRTLVEYAASKAYEEYGIDYSTTVAEILANPGYAYPCMRDLARFLERYREGLPDGRERDNAERVLAKLRKLTSGPYARLWEGTTSVPADAGLIVLDSLKMPEDRAVAEAQYFNAFRWLQSQSDANRGSSRTMLTAVEEAHLITMRFPQAAGIVAEGFLRGRKYGSFWAVSSQQISHFLQALDETAGQAMFDQATYRFVGQTDGKNLEDAARLLHLPEETALKIERLDKGAFFARVGSSSIWMKNELDGYERELFGKGGGR